MSAPTRTMKARNLRPDRWIHTALTPVPGTYRVLGAGAVFTYVDAGVEREGVRLTLRRVGRTEGYIDQVFPADADVKVI